MGTVLVKEELKNISGGAIHWAALAGVIIGACAFISGVVDGYLRPYGCRK